MELNRYTALEEKYNVYTHLFGFIASVVGLVFLSVYAALEGTVWHMVSFPLFGISLCVLYAASTFYHAAKTPERRRRLKIFDHAAIYFLIAGSYTPFLLVPLNGAWGWSLFGVVWGIALIGIILKIFFTGKFVIISTLAYVAMGWVIVIAWNPLTEKLPANGVDWLIAGGVAYTVGALIYALKKIPFGHPVFHIFVLIGSYCHFHTVFFYLV